MNEQKTCCICGPLLTDGKCLSCGHAQCAECEVFVKHPTIEELQAENVALKATIARLSAPVSDEEEFHFDNDQVLAAVVGTDYLRNRILQLLWGHTSGEKWALYRAVVKLAIAARLTPPAHGDAPAQKEPK